MVWNKPNGNDPWGNGSNDGPPDIDKVFKSFKNMIFGKKPSDTDSSGGRSYKLIFSLLVLLYFISGFYIVKPAEQAVVTRLGKFNRILGPGPHWYPSFIELPTVKNTEELVSIRQDGIMLTKDENLVSVDIQVQYRINDLYKYLFEIREPEKSLRQATESALRQAVGHNKLDFIITSGRAEIEEQTRQQIIATVGHYNAGFYIAAVTLKESKAPEQVKAAFDDVTKAREDKERFINEAEGYYNKIVPEAKGFAQQILQEAEAYKQEVINIAIGNAQRFNLVLPEYKKAPKITKTRLYLDTLEQVYTQTNKILIDVNSGNNLIYLPLDRLIKDKKQDIKINADLDDNVGESTHPKGSNFRDFDRRRTL